MPQSVTHEDLVQKIAALEKALKTQKHANDLLKKSEQRFKSLYENVPIVYQSLDESGCFIDVNQAWLAMFGYVKEEVIGRPFEEFLHPDWTDHFKENFQILKAVDEIFGVEFEVLKKDGSYLYVSFNGKIQTDENGKFKQTHCIVNNITEKKQARESLKKSEEKYRRIFESIQDVFYRTDLNGIINVISPSVKNIIGYDPDEMIGRSVMGYYKDSVEREKLFKEMMSSGKVHNYSVEFIAKNGETIIGSFNSQVIYGDDGHPIGFEGMIRDVTEHRKAEEEIAIAHQDLAQIFEASVPMCVIGSDYHIIRVNDRFSDFFDIEKGSFAGKICSDICQWSGCQTEACVLKKIFNGETAAESEVLRITADGKKRSCIVAASPYRDMNGQVIGVVESFTDITPRIQLEEQLRVSQKMESIGTLAGGIAHDFNNILSAVIGFTELSIDDTEAGTMLYENLTEIMSAGNRARELVQQILDFSRHDEEETRSVQILPIVKEAVKMLRATIPSSIQIKETLCSEKLIVDADPTQLHQVIINLANNARQAMADAIGVLEFSVDLICFDGSIQNQYPDFLPGDYARITVSDTGSGIAKANLDKIFDPYFTTKPKGSGTGLGLFVAHGIVKKHQGVITVYSESGKGTTFHVYLPVVKKYFQKKAVRTAGPLPTGDERILLVDDELPILRMQQRILERLGYAVAIRVSSVEALEAFRASPENYDLIITDMTMPDMTGDRLAHEIKEIIPDMPVILCTGFSEKVNGGRASALHIDDFLMKPVDQTQLAKIVRSVLDSRRRKNEGDV